MTYFSRISMNPAGAATHRLARIACTDGYREHQYLWRLFETDPDAERDFLFRREQVEGWPRFYMISGRAPGRTDGFWNIESKEYAPKIYADQQLAFSLRVNPIVTRKGKDGKRQRHDVVMDLKTRTGYGEQPIADRPPLSALVQEAGIAWLEARAEKHGFAIVPDAVRVDGYRQHQVTKRGGKHSIRYSTLDFTGLLTVTDPEAFRRALLDGIGPAKAFGCGMMLVRRV